MRMKKPAMWFLLIILVNGCAVQQRKFEATYASTRRALISGEIKETLSAYEAQAAEAERNATASWFPQQDWASAARAYSEASRLAGFSGQFQKAIGYGEKALRIAERTKNPEYQVYALSMLIDAYRGLRNFAKARELTQNGFEIVKEIPVNTNSRSNWETTLYFRLGLDLMQQRAYEKAIDAFSQAIYFAEDSLSNLRTGDRTRIEDARTTVILRVIGLANAYRQTGKLQNALEQYQRAFDHIRQWELNYAYENDLYWNIGDLYRQQNNYPEALKNFQNALALAESRGQANGIASASRSIGYVFLYHLGKPAEAIPHYAKGIRVIESTRSLLESEQYRQSYFEGGLGAYESMIRALLTVGKQEDAFNYSEKARSRAFLDVLGSKIQLSKLKSGLLEEERALQERIAAIKARSVGQDIGQTNKVGLQKELQAAEESYNVFLANVRKQDKEQASLMNVEPLTLNQIQGLLDPGVTMLEYFVTSSAVYVWVVEKDRVQFVSTTIPRTDLVGKVILLRDTIYQLGEKERFNGLSQELHKLLIQAALPHVTGKELIIVPHDVLHYLPFQALLSEDGKYLIEKYPIYYLSSASLMQFTQGKETGDGRAAVGARESRLRRSENEPSVCGS